MGLLGALMYAGYGLYALDASGYQSEDEAEESDTEQDAATKVCMYAYGCACIHAACVHACMYVFTLTLTVTLIQRQP